ncbi:hypothetical protein [Alicyclobacillus fastidiosus]|nr:hypothetical protein [Alicyclobacillus fastidiosus]GMA62580.1 hypothetical protein GCM10025859_30200 [Alicyclobacillus fastidiosus]
MEFVDDDKFDFVLMEGGILHYFVDLNALFTVVSKLLVNGGRFILRDYHPTRKLLSCHDGQMIANGNYFKDTISDGIVPYIHLLSE